MRIGILGGYAKSLLNFRGPLIKTMMERGHSVIAMAPEDDPQVRSRLAAWGVGYYCVPIERNNIDPAKDVKALAQIVGLLRRSRPDVLLSYTMKAVVYGSLAARLSGVRSASIITGLGASFANEGSSRRSFSRSILLGLLRLSVHGNEVVFFQNPDDLQFFLKRGLIKQHRAVLVDGTGVDLDYFPYSEPKLEPPVFILLARLIREKGIGEYAEAAKRLKRLYPRVNFRLLGFFETTLNAITKEDVARWVREGSIEYLGYVDDVRPFLKDCTAVVLPSYYPEGVPRSLQEALAVGRPVVTTDTPGCREVVRDGRNGYLIRPKNVNDLTVAMEDLIQNPATVRRFGSKSRELAEERFDVRKINLKILEALGL